MVWCCIQGNYLARSFRERENNSAGQGILTFQKAGVYKKHLPFLFPVIEIGLKTNLFELLANALLHFRILKFCTFSLHNAGNLI